MAERSRDWLAQAERDLEQARWSLQGGFYEWACFVSQQAAEKGVKALYEALHGEVWGHAISKMLASLPEGHRPDEALIERAIHLDRFYIPTRYPNGFDTGSPKDYFTRRDAEEAIRDADEVVRYCKGKIS